MHTACLGKEGFYCEQYEMVMSVYAMSSLTECIYGNCLACGGMYSQFTTTVDTADPVSVVKHLGEGGWRTALNIFNLDHIFLQQNNGSMCKIFSLTL